MGLLGDPGSQACPCDSYEFPAEGKELCQYHGAYNTYEAVLLPLGHRHLQKNKGATAMKCCPQQECFKVSGRREKSWKSLQPDVLFQQSLDGRKLVTEGFASVVVKKSLLSPVTTRFPDLSFAITPLSEEPWSPGCTIG